MDHATQFPRVWGDYFGEEGGGGEGVRQSRANDFRQEEESFVTMSGLPARSRDRSCRDRSRVTFRQFLRDGSIPLFWLVDHLEATWRSVDRAGNDKRNHARTT